MMSLGSVRLKVGVLCCLILATCGRGGTVVSQNDGVIRRTGVFSPAGSSVTITVTEIAERGMHYSVKDSSGSEIISAEWAINTFHRWWLYWDEDTKCLWVHSSDIGTDVWSITVDGIYEKYVVDDEWKRRMPRVAFQSLSRAEQSMIDRSDTDIPVPQHEE